MHKLFALLALQRWWKDANSANGCCIANDCTDQSVINMFIAMRVLDEVERIERRGLCIRLTNIFGSKDICGENICFRCRNQILDFIILHFYN